MTNPFYNRVLDVLPGNRVGSVPVESELDLVAQGFDKLPTPAQLHGSSANYAVAGGAVNVYTATVAATYLTAYADGLSLMVKFGTTNTTTTPTLNLNSLGAKTITRADGSALAAGELTGIVPLVYSTTAGTFLSLGGASAQTEAAAVSATAAAASAATATAAAASATAAAASATNAANVNGTSATSRVIAQGLMTFAYAETNRAVVAGMWLQFSSAANVANYMHGQVTAWNSGTQTVTVNITTTGGAGTFADWVISLSGPKGAAGAGGFSGERAIGSADTIVASDVGKTLRLTGTGWTLSATALATLTNAFGCYISHEGTGPITFDPNGSEVVRGVSGQALTTIKVYPGEKFTLIATTGATAAWVPVGRAETVVAQTDTVSGTPATLDIEAPYTDPEADQVLHDFYGVSGDSAGIFQARTKLSGAYVTASTYYYGGGAGNDKIPLTGSHAAAVSVNGRFHVKNVQASSAGGWWAEWQVLDTTNALYTDNLVTNATGTVVQGTSFYKSAGNLDAGTVVTRIVRK